MKNDIFNYITLIYPCPSISPRVQGNLSKQDPSIALIASLILVGIFTLAEGLSEIGLEVYPSEFLRGTMACTGVEFCKLAITNTKDRATALVAELEIRMPVNAIPLAVHVNGCPNSCAQIQVADIGLKGIRAPDADGNDIEAFQIHLGGRLAQDSGFGSTFKGVRLPGNDLPDYVERVFTRFIAEHDGEDAFSTWALRADEELTR